MREEIATEASTVVRTAFQIIYEILAFAEKMSEKLCERVTAKKLAKLYADNVRQSSGGVVKSETRSDRMIDDAMTIARRGLVVPEVQQVLSKADSLWGHQSPFNSIAKVNGIISKCKPSQIVFCFQAIFHFVATNAIEAATLTYRYLIGEGAKVGYVEIILMKQKILSHLLNVWLTQKGCSGEIVAVLREKISTPNLWRANLQPNGGSDEPANMTWKKDWPRAMDLALQFIEDTVYGCVFDGPLRQGCKSRRSPEEILDYQAFAEKLEDIAKAFKDDEVAKNGGAAGGREELTNLCHKWLLF